MSPVKCKATQECLRNPVTGAKEDCPGCGHKWTYPTPSCRYQCSANSSSAYVLYKGKSSYSVFGEDAYQRELLANGPFEVGFDVYKDFLAYRGGVYNQNSDDLLGGHAVRVVGWGTLNGTKYWKIANSWNTDWGLDGYFLIVRGQDECGSEQDGSAGLA